MAEKPRNLLWDALVEVFGYSPALRGEQRLWGQIVQDFRIAEVTPAQVKQAARGYRRLYPHAAFTVTALRNQFSASLAEADSRTERKRPSEYVEATGDEVPPPADLVDRLRRKRPAG